MAPLLRRGMKLWHCANARSLRCLWTMEELGITDYSLVTMPFPPRVLHRPYLEKNSLGTIPYFEDAHGAQMTESVAICMYLCEKCASVGGADLAVGPGETDFSDYLNWLVHSEATLTFPQTVVLRYTFQEPGTADAAAAGYGRWYLARLRRLNRTLEDGREFLCGGRFTIADVCVTYALYLGTTLPGTDGKPLASRYKPHVRDYLERMMGRPGWAAAQVAQERSAAAFKTGHQSWNRAAAAAKL